MKRRILLFMMTALLSVGAWAAEIWNEGATLNWNYFTLPKMSMTAGDVLTFHITSVGDGWSVMDLYTTDETKEGWDKKDTKLMSLDHRSGSNVIVVVTDDIASAAPDGIIVYGENNVVVSSVDYEKKQATLNLYSSDEGTTVNYWGSGLSKAMFGAVQTGDLLTVTIKSVGADWGANFSVTTKAGGNDNVELATASISPGVLPTTLKIAFTDDMVAAAKSDGLYLNTGTYTYTSVDIVYTPTVIIGSAGYATLGYAAALDLTGIEAFTAKVEDGVAKLTSVKGKKIPANMGIILKGSGDVTIPLTTETTDNITDNQLLVSDGKVKGDGSSIYVLANGTNGVGFYLLQSGDALAAGKAYLSVPAGARQFIGFGNDATGISEELIAESEEFAPYYDLQSRRVAQPAKGLYIVNGKKVIIK